MKKKSDNLPHAQRRGWLKNGNIPGDFSQAPRCGAKTRRGSSCLSPAMKNGRCRMHGGKSTGPKTIEGKERAQRGNWRNGRYSIKAKKERKQFRALLLECRALFKQMKD